MFVFSFKNVAAGENDVAEDLVLATPATFGKVLRLFYFYFRKINNLKLMLYLSIDIPRLSAPSCHLLGKINTMVTFFSTR